MARLESPEPHTDRGPQSANDRLEAGAERAAQLLRALANARRLMILCRLADGESSVGELVRSVGISQSALSQHLARLRKDGLVATRRQSQTIYYRLGDPVVEAVMHALTEALICGDRKDR